MTGLQIKPRRILIYTVLVLVAAIFLMPIFMVVITAFKNPADINLETVWSLPNPIDFQGFGEAVNAFLPNLRNSFILVVPATLLSAIMGSMNGYVLSKWKFKGANILFPLMLFGMFIPTRDPDPAVPFLKSINLYGASPPDRRHVVYGLPITTLIFRNTTPKCDEMSSGQHRRAGSSASTATSCSDLAAGFVVVSSGVQEILNNSCRRAADLDRQPADHGPAQPARGRGGGQVEPADGGGAAGRAAPPAGLHPARPVLHPRPAGREREGVGWAGHLSASAGVRSRRAPVDSGLRRAAWLTPRRRLSDEKPTGT
jgi:hypothetical protein